MHITDLYPGRDGEDDFWVMPAVMKRVMEHYRSLAAEPPIPLGTPAPYQPGGPHWQTSATGREYAFEDERVSGCNPLQSRRWPSSQRTGALCPFLSFHVVIQLALSWVYSSGLLIGGFVGATMSSKAIREALAALGVIGSLLFVGFEIRQNTMVARASAYQAIGVATAATFDSAAHDPQWVASIQKTADVMDETDWTQFRLYMTIFARLAETVLLQVEQGLLPEDAMERLGYRGWTTFFKYPKTACVWPLIRPGVSTSFREYVEGAQDPNTIDCSNFDIPSVTPTQ